MYKYPGGFPLKIVAQRVATGNLCYIGYCHLIPRAEPGRGIRMETRWYTLGLWHWVRGVLLGVAGGPGLQAHIGGSVRGRPAACPPLGTDRPAGTPPPPQSGPGEQGVSGGWGHSTWVSSGVNLKSKFLLDLQNIHILERTHFMHHQNTKNLNYTIRTHWEIQCLLCAGHFSYS